ncbi:MAG: hypothetical protein V1912_10870 [bacterium]
MKPTRIIFPAVIFLTLLVVLLLVAACGGGETTITSKQAASSTTLPTPTVAGTIAFTKLVAEGDYDICTVNTDGTGLTTIAGGEGCQMSPKWSPDGSQMVFAESAPGDVDPIDVWVMNADGSGKTQLTNGPIRNWHPTWSPDGTQIAYTSWLWAHNPQTGEGERAVIMVMNADGSDAHMVTSDEGEAVDYYPRWAKDGKIYFCRVDGTGQPTAEYRVNPDGSGLELVMTTGDSHRELLNYELSPDGEKAAYQELDNAYRFVDAPAGGGGTAVPLLDPVADYLGTASADAAWSPDGKALAVAGLADSGSGSGDFGRADFTLLFVVNADGSGLSLVPDIEAVRDPDWRPE